MRVEFAEILETIASAVIELPGVSRRNPHAFAEAKSELYEHIRRQARAFRTVPARTAKPFVACASGPRLIGQRTVLVEVRRRRPPAAR